MNQILPLLTLICSVAANLDVQAAVLRGRVATSAANQFYLDSTKIPVTSTVVNLSQWSGLDAIMKVTNVGTANSPLLHVDTIGADQRNLDMSPLPLGTAGKFLVLAPAGAAVAIFLDLASNTAFTPVPSLGTWLLGQSPYLLAVGFTDAQGEFPAKYVVPSNHQLLGLLVTSQALVGEGGVWFLTNPDRQSVVP